MSDVSSQDIFDREEALENMGGMADLLKELAQTLIDEIPKLLKSLRAAVTAGDAKQVNAVAHSIKGSVTPFAAKLAHDAAWKLEKAGASGDLANSADMMSDLEAELVRLQEALTSI